MTTANLIKKTFNWVAHLQLQKFSNYHYDRDMEICRQSQRWRSPTSYRQQEVAESPTSCRQQEVVLVSH